MVGDMPNTATRPTAQQDRSRRTEKLILQAALAALTDVGEEGITMSLVSERAGVSVGSIYRRFGSREELVVAMTAEFAQGFSRQVRRRLSAARPEHLASPEAVIRHATHAIARTFEKNRAAFGRLFLLGLNVPKVYEAGQRASVAGGEAYAEFVLQARGAIRRPDPAAAVDYTYRMVYAMCAHRITQGPSLESSRPLSWKRMVEELVEVNAAYLLTPPSTTT